MKNKSSVVFSANPKIGQGRPETSQDGPKMAPGWPKMAPRWPKKAPRWPQDGGQQGSTIDPRSKLRFRPPFRLPGTGFGSILGGWGDHFGTILERSWDHSGTEKHIKSWREHCKKTKKQITIIIIMTISKPFFLHFKQKKDSDKTKWNPKLPAPSRFI